MKRFLLLILLSIALHTYAGEQNPLIDKNAEATFHKGIQLNVTDAEPLAKTVESYLLGEYAGFLGTPSGLEITDRNESVMGHHLTYTQTCLGLPVYGGYIKVNLDKTQQIRSIFTRLANLEQVPDKLPGRIYHEQVVAAMRAFQVQEVEPVIFAKGNRGQYALRVRATHLSGETAIEAILDTAMNVLYERDLHRSLKTGDTSVKAYIFNPDPLTTAKTTYGGAYTDNGDQDSEALNNQRREVYIDVYKPVDRKKIYLAGPYVEIVDVSPPGNEVPFTKDIFNYTRSQRNFEAVNVYYHISFYQKYLESLGFGDLVDYTIQVDPIALQGDDQSHFLEISNKKGKLLFGNGGVDDAEDADVIIHEFAHAISHSASYNSYQGGSEAAALEEGLADYFACSYSRSISEFNWQRVYSWDGNNEFWEGRSCFTEKKYPDDLTGQDIYADGEIWAGTLMQIWELIGSRKTDELMLASLFSYGSGITMDQAAKLFLQADDILNKNRNRDPIMDVFVKAGLVEDTHVSLEDEDNGAGNWIVSHYDTRLEIEFPQTGQVTMRILSIDGKLIEREIHPSTDRLSVTLPGEVKAGIYFIVVETPTGAASYKIAKLN